MFEIIQEYFSLVVVLVLLSVPGAVRISQLALLRLFNNQALKRHFFVLNKRLVIYHTFSKAKGVDFEDPNTIIPSINVGKLLFLYLVFLLPVGIELRRELKDSTLLLSLKKSNPFIPIGYSPRPETAISVLQKNGTESLRGIYNFTITKCKMFVYFCDSFLTQFCT